MKCEKGRSWEKQKSFMKKRRDPHYLADIEQASQLISAFLKGITKRQFKKDPMRYWAVIKQLEIIGEAARHLSESFRKAHSKIPWTKMIGLRNVLVYVYHDADLDAVWKTATTSVPLLLMQILELKENLGICEE